jgi:hypothetical protein
MRGCSLIYIRWGIKIDILPSSGLSFVTTLYLLKTKERAKICMFSFPPKGKSPAPGSYVWRGFRPPLKLHQHLTCLACGVSCAVLKRLIFNSRSTRSVSIDEVSL